MAGRPGALQRAHVLFVEANGRRNQSRHTLTIHRAAWEGKGESSNSPRGFYWFVSGHNARASFCPPNDTRLSREGACQSGAFFP